MQEIARQQQRFFFRCKNQSLKFNNNDMILRDQSPLNIYTAFLYISVCSTCRVSFCLVTLPCDPTNYFLLCVVSTLEMKFRSSKQPLGTSSDRLSSISYYYYYDSAFLNQKKCCIFLLQILKGDLDDEVIIFKYQINQIVILTILFYFTFIDFGYVDPKPLIVV